jgi:L-alanine-DL-glutamate epimerase-like enolase superfamily enzyme
MNARFDEFDLLLIGQPFAEDDLESHRVLIETIHTSACLDESGVSAASAADAIRRGAAGATHVSYNVMGCGLTTAADMLSIPDEVRTPESSEVDLSNA